MTDVQARSAIASPHPPRNAQDKKSDNWVQCDRCQKWRRIPAEVDASKLPDNWFCDMNQWDDTHNSCSVSEENADSSPTLTALSSSGAIVWHGMPKCFLQTDDRRRFFATLIEFLQSTGQFHRLGRFPNVGKKPLDLYVLFLGVVRMGGMDQIIEKTGWRPISELFNFPPTTTSSGNSLMKNYRKYLYLFEKKFYREYSTGVTSLSNLRAANWNNDAVYEQISDPHSKSSPTSPAARARRKRKQEQKMSSGISVLEEAIAAEIKSSSKSPKMSGSKSPKSPSAANGRSLLSLSRHSPYVQPQPQLDSMDDDQDDPDEFDLDQHPSQFEDSEPHQPADDNSSDQEESGQSMRDRYGSASMMPSSSSSSSQVHMTHFASSSSSGYVPHLSSDSLHRLQVEEDEEEEAEYQRSVAKRQKAAAFGTSPRADPLLLRRILQSSAVPSPRLTSTSASAPSAAPWADSGALSLSSAFSMASAAAASFAGAVAAMPQVSSSPTPSLSPRSASPAQTPTLLRRGQPLHSRKTVNFSSTVHFRNDPRGGDAQGSTPSPFSNPEEPSPYSQGKSSPSSLVSSTSMTGRSGRADGMELIQLPANRISHLNLDQILQRLESRMNREDEVYRRVDSISQALARRIEGIRSQLPPIKTDIF